MIKKGKNLFTYVYTAYLAFLWDQVWALICPPLLVLHSWATVWARSLSNTQCQPKEPQPKDDSRKLLPVISSAPAASANSLHSPGRAFCALPQGRANSRAGTPNLSQLLDRTAGCCLPGKAGANFGKLSLILRRKQPGFYHQGRSSSSSTKAKRHLQGETQL